MLQSVLEDAYALGRFGECLVLIDTCQAATLIPSVRAVIPIEQQKTPPHCSFLASSSFGEESYSYGFDSAVKPGRFAYE